jgi:tetratricopeptide (TPR) repeat protein
LALSLALAVFAQRAVGRDDLSLAYYNLANRHAQLGQLDLAIATYWKALRRNPRYLSTYNNLAAAYERNGQPAEAVATWQELRRLAAARGLERYVERADRHLRALDEQGSSP